MTQRIRIASRGSRLALWQAHHVRDLLTRAHPGIQVEFQVLTTRGDQIQDRPLREVGGKGLFVKEIQEALLRGDADLAVHSLKDYPAENPAELRLACVPRREDFRDALLTLDARNNLNRMKKGARIGTGSLRRRVQLLALRPDLQVEELRGNVDTRVRKLEEGQYDGVVLAAAGLNRLGLTQHRTQVFDPSEMIPAPAQGALGLEIRHGDVAAAALLEPLHDPAAWEAVVLERDFLTRVGGSCRTPVGCFARIVGEQLFLRACLAAEDGSAFRSGMYMGGVREARDVVSRAADDLLARG